MKFLVDELPYYEGFCPFVERCSADIRMGKCPRHWTKDKICSNDNPSLKSGLLNTLAKLGRIYFLNNIQKLRQILMMCYVYVLL